MMNYEIFKEVVTEKFMDYLSVHYKDMKLEIRPIDKVNVTLENLARDVEIDHMMKKFDSLMEKDCDKRIITIFTEPILQYGAEVFEEFEKSKTLCGCENEVKNSETKINCIYR